MDRPVIRAFAAGMLVCALATLLFYRLTWKDGKAVAHQWLEKNHSIALKESRYEALENELGRLKNEVSRLKSVSRKSTADGDEKPEETPIPVEIAIEPGMSLKEIADLLESRGIIRDSREFIEFVSGKEKESSIRAGTYRLHREMTYQEIVNRITSS